MKPLTNENVVSLSELTNQALFCAAIMATSILKSPDCKHAELLEDFKYPCTIFYGFCPGVHRSRREWTVEKCNYTLLLTKSFCRGVI